MPFRNIICLVVLVSKLHILLILFHLCSVEYLVQMYQSLILDFATIPAATNRISHAFAYKFSYEALKVNPIIFLINRHPSMEI